MKKRNLPAKIEKKAVAKTAPALPEIKTPMDLLRAVSTGGASIDVVERVVALYEKSEAQRKAQEFHDAMAALQSRLPTIPKTKCVYTKDGKLLYKFADLTDIVKAIAPLEKEFGFHHRFDFGEREGGGCKCTCIVTHRAGHSESTTVSIPPTTGQNTNAAQNNGIEMTYGQRYSIVGAYGITSAVQDTDGNTQNRVDYNRVTPEQAKELQKMLDATDTDEITFAKCYGMNKIADIPALVFNDARRLLNIKLDRLLEEKKKKGS